MQLKLSTNLDSFKNTSSHFSLQHVVEGECPAGWEAVLGSCYFRSDHTKAGLRYTAAMASCREKLSYLATVNDEEEMNLYFSKLLVLNSYTLILIVRCMFDF